MKKIKGLHLLKKIQILTILFIFLFSISMYGQNPVLSAHAGIQSLALKNVQGKPFHFSTLNESTASIFIFLAPECPISQQSTLTLRKLAEIYKTRMVQFYGIIPGNFYSVESVEAFQKKYLIPFMILMDTDLKLNKLFNATVTPEVFVVDKNYSMVYSGAIDNSYQNLGKKQMITHHYLENAIASVINHTSLALPHTKAIGCFIE